MKKKKAIQVLTVLLLTTAALCGYFFVCEYNAAQHEISEYSILRDEYTTTTHEQNNNMGEGNSEDDTELSEKVKLPYINVDFETLLIINPDTIGWISMPNTNISYPVVQGTDNMRYLNTSFDGKHSKAGTLFADMYNNMETLDTNTIIHGHNMGLGRSDMFSTLLLYKDYDHYSKHRYIQFDTIYENHGWWEVFAVLHLDIHSTAFQHQQTKFINTSDFMSWVEYAKTLSLHNIDLDISPYSNILTLSTCDRSKYGRNGRLLVLAMKSNNS